MKKKQVFNRLSPSLSPSEASDGPQWYYGARKGPRWCSYESFPRCRLLMKKKKKYRTKVCTSSFYREFGSKFITIQFVFRYSKLLTLIYCLIDNNDNFC